MKKISLLLFALAASVSAHANQYSLTSSPLDFGAPVVANRTNLTQAGAGTIVYDTTSMGFYGLPPGQDPVSGSWNRLSSPTGTSGILSYGTGVEVLHRAIIASGCASVTSQDGSWITSVSKPGAGKCEVTITTGTFSAVPTCTCSTYTGNSYCAFGVTGATTQTFFSMLSDDDGGNEVDNVFTVICTGPQ